MSAELAAFGRVQRQRTKGWRQPPNTVTVARPTQWGNRWFPLLDISAGIWRVAGHLPKDGAGRAQCALVGPEFATRADAVADCIRRYRLDLEEAADDQGITLAELTAPLRGKNLACWCPLDEPCHVDVLLELAN